MTVKFIKLDKTLTWGAIASIVLFIVSGVISGAYLMRDVEELKGEREKRQTIIDNNFRQVDTKLGELQTNVEVVKNGQAMTVQQLSVIQADMRNIYALLVKDKIAQGQGESMLHHADFNRENKHDAQ